MRRGCLMIIKASDGRSGDIEVLESLLKDEITADQRSAIETEVYTLRKGAQGERETAHILDRTYGHSGRVAVIHDLRLSDGLGGYIQFDHVLLHAFLKRVAVLETKNFSGRNLQERAQRMVRLVSEPATARRYTQSGSAGRSCRKVA